jgi:hypothetical protein
MGELQRFAMKIADYLTSPEGREQFLRDLINSDTCHFENRIQQAELMRQKWESHLTKTFALDRDTLTNQLHKLDFIVLEMKRELDWPSRRRKHQEATRRGKAYRPLATRLRYLVD